MKHQQRVAYAHEALDRIHVVQTLLSSILEAGDVTWQCKDGKEVVRTWEQSQ